MKLYDAKVLYWRCTLAGIGVEKAWEMDEWVLELVLNSRSLTGIVGFEMWCVRSKIIIDAPAEPTKEQIDAAKEEANKSAVGGLMASFGGNTPPPLAPGEKAHVPAPKVSIDNIPPPVKGEFDGMQAQGTKDPGQK